MTIYHEDYGYGPVEDRHENLPAGMSEWRPEDTWGLAVILLGVWFFLGVLGGIGLYLAVMGR